MRAIEATDRGALAEEIVAVEGSSRTRARGATRRSSKLSKLPPVMDPEGTTTVGNAPG